MRSPAQRSADAAKEIKRLIATSVERVGQGNGLVEQAGTTMDDVVGSIRRVGGIMGEISVASQERSQGVTQVGQAVTQMDHGTHQNAELVEECAASAENRRQRANQVVQAVAMVKLAEPFGSAGPRRPRTAPGRAGRAGRPP